MSGKHAMATDKETIIVGLTLIGLSLAAYVSYRLTVYLINRQASSDQHLQRSLLLKDCDESVV